MSSRVKAGASLVRRIDRAIWELICEGARADEIRDELERRFGADRTFFWAKVHESRLDEQALDEEWTS